MNRQNLPPNPRPVLLRPYGYTAPRMKPFLSPSDRLNPLGANEFTFPFIPLSIQPPQAFATMRPAPSNLRPRHPDQQEQLSALDVDYALTDKELVRDMKILEANGLMGDLHGKMEVSEARGKLQAHCIDRMGFVQASSERLQAATSMRNDHIFDIPNPRCPIPPRVFGPLRPTPVLAGQNGNIEFGGTNSLANNVAPNPNSSIQNSDRRQDSGFDLRRNLIMSNASSVEVDPGTGKGLREWLLMNGKKYGMRKRECTSISLHDFTPNPETGKFANVLLGHYGKSGIGERVDVYETNVLNAFIDPKTGIAQPVMEVWVWFLISRPILSILANNPSTLPVHLPESSSSSSESANIPASERSDNCMPGLQQEARDKPMHTTQNRPPPNFPSPIPNSFVVFACPATNLTQYNEFVETVAPPPPSTLSSRSQDAPWIVQSAGKRIHKRKDYDLSHQGIPLFEFDGATVMFGPDCTDQFLSVEAMGPWYSSDPYEMRSPEQLKDLFDCWREVVGEDEMEGIQELAMSGQQRRIRNLAHELPAPYRGAWWDSFYRGFWEDCERWRAVRRAMGMGKLRVVVRWDEVQLEEAIDPLLREGDVEMQGMEMSGASVKEDPVLGGKDRKGRFAAGSAATVAGLRHVRGRDKHRHHKRSGLGVTGDVPSGAGQLAATSGDAIRHEIEK